jgi:polyphosphate kinase
MNRNMLRRVEIAWPIVDAKNRARILQECCQVYLEDNHDAWLLQADGSYKLTNPITNAISGLSKSPVFSAQQYLIQKYAD